MPVTGRPPPPDIRGRTARARPQLTLRVGPAVILLQRPVRAGPAGAQLRVRPASGQRMYPDRHELLLPLGEPPTGGQLFRWVRPGRLRKQGGLIDHSINGTVSSVGCP